MDNRPTWLKEIIVVNENADPLHAGDVMIFASALALTHHLEPWWVSEVSHLALSGIGDRVVLGGNETSVFIERTESYHGGLDLLRAWLEPTAMRVHKMRADAERKMNLATGSLAPDGVMPESIEGLIAYIGFER